MERIFVVLLTCLAVSAFAGDEAPECLSHGREVPVNNTQVLRWKATTRSNYHDRGHVSGTVGRIFQDRNGHHHFELIIGSHAGDTIEIVYNEDFGTVPDIYEGMHVEACGDYITATSQNGQYPPSPDGAILHWVHASTNLRRHPSGFLIMDGEVCGQDVGTQWRR